MKQLNRETVETTREAPKRTFTVEHRENLSKAMKGKPAWNKGLTMDDPRVRRGVEKAQANPNLRANLSKALLGHADTFRRKHTPEEIERIRRAQAGRPKAYPVWNKGLTKHTDARLARVGRSISKALLAKPEAWRKETSRIAKMYVKFPKVSKFEQEVADIFAARGIDILQQHPIRIGDVITFVDIYLPDKRVCVYIDGTYWHHRTEVQRRDIITTATLTDFGYKVFRFWDNTQSPRSIVDTIRMKI